MSIKRGKGIGGFLRKIQETKMKTETYTKVLKVKKKNPNKAEKIVKSKKKQKIQVK